MLIGAEGARLQREAAGQVRPHRRKSRRGGLPPAPRKASDLKRKSTGLVKMDILKKSKIKQLTIPTLKPTN